MMLIGTAYAAPRPTVVFMSPDSSLYWSLSADFMRVVAADLNIDLEVQVDVERNRFSYIRMADRILNRPNKPDYLVFMCREHVTAPMLRMANDAGVKVFTFDTNVPAEARNVLGAPRQVLDNWIGHVSPDNVAAGQTLMRVLARQVQDRRLPQSGRALPLVALSGSLDSSAAKDRNLGLQQVVNDNGMQLLQLVYADWNEQEAQTKTEALLKRYPRTAAIWSASDGMALGAIAAAKKVGRRPGEDIFIGGMDWEPRALKAIRRGELAASLGRHFMGGGLLLILINDYHQGYDFAEALPAPILHYQLELATRENVDTIERVLNQDNWQRVNFARFSRALNPELRGQPPEGNRLMNALVSALKAE
jgi:ABC-type sugar transport system substrate-binding protein